VTLGGAIANDVHGKNHHRAGTFGCHLEGLMLYRSDMGPIFCSPTENADLFRATIGGLGLTGVIGWADLRLKRIAGNGIESQALPFRSLDEFVALSNDSDQSFEYTVAWIDCLSGPRPRGIFFRGNHAKVDVRQRSRSVAVPFALPEFCLNKTAVGLFNRVYHRLKSRNSHPSLAHYDPFFYPLDSLRKWNLLYGKGGLIQYQCVVPAANIDALNAAITLISASNHGCFLGVLKAFGDIRSPGLLSFPRPGVTLALDLPVRGDSTHKLLQTLDELVLANGGALYPAKDARMSSKMFQASFPNWREIVPFTDAKFSSSFWRRVTND
jgi:FAD/FMN-containing dehydrogenase